MFPDEKKQLGKVTMLKQKSRQVTVMPKLTRAEIKKRLNHLKFPIVVLGKDQVSSPMEIFDYNPPQFDGLDSHIWPFMVEWTKKNTEGLIERVTDNLRKVSFEVHKKPNNTCVQLPGSKKSEKRFLQQGENTACPFVPKKEKKPMRHFKDKMIKFLYKNPSPCNIEETKDAKCTKTEKIDACTEPIIEVLAEPLEQKNSMYTLENKPNDILFFSDPQKPKEILNLLQKQTKNMFMSNRHRSYPRRMGYMNGSRSDHWNFIDSIIRKVRSGVYYNYDETMLSAKSDDVNFVENLMNTSSDDHNTSGKFILFHFLNKT